MNKVADLVNDVKRGNLEVDWKTQDSHFNSILFYNLSNDPQKRIAAKKILEGTKYHTLILKSDTDLNLKNAIALNQDDFIETQERILDLIYPMSEKIILGVTGTNGKTTTVDLIRQIILQSKKKIITVGTLGVYLNEKRVENFNLTTPNYIDLRKVLYKYRDSYDFFAMELSSHALDQKRIGMLKFNQIGWTNLTQDHLDYHKSMNAYFEAKMNVFKILKEEGHVYLPYSQKELRKKITTYDVNWHKNKIKTTNPFLQVSYNLDNLELAMNMLSNYIDLKMLDYDNIKAPPGRFNIVEYKNNYIIIDFAHTPDAIESISKELRKSFPDKSLKVLFGCGGDRDKTKRPMMAKAAEKYSEFVYITSDNPRFENPEDIIEDSIQGLQSNNFTKITDRALAIKTAINELNNNVLLIAGKGHENYIDEKGIKRFYSDMDTVKEYIND